MKLQFQNILSNTSNNFTLHAKLSWSKNIREERDSPMQIMLASMDDRICILLNLAIYLELCTTTMAAEAATFVYGNGKDGDRAVRDYLNDIFGIIFIYFNIPIFLTNLSLTVLQNQQSSKDN
jgi:hypothetical protein